jgi:hypothetical protein
MAVPGHGQIGRSVAPGGPSFAGPVHPGPGERHGHGHFRRGPVVTYGFGGYDYYDYPHYYDYYGPECWQVRIVRGRYRRVWVCY